jgi:large subunit ribosomal protein L1
MGKIRVKTIGLEDQEQEKKQAKADAEAKRIATLRQQASDAKKTKTESEQSPVVTKVPIGTKKATHAKKQYSVSYKSVVVNRDIQKKYALSDAIVLLIKLQRTKFDETVELHINTAEKSINGNVTLPHGTGKQTKVVIANIATDQKAVEDLIKSIEAGKIDFDILIATPETMPKLAKVARVLGPRGLMPNPKNGTVTTKPDEIASQFAGGQINFKTESKFPLLHLAVGKVSFGEDKLNENIKTAIGAIKIKNMKAIVLKSTMSPAIKLDLSAL